MISIGWCSTGNGFPSPDENRGGNTTRHVPAYCSVKDEFNYVNGYDNLDNIGAHDEVVFVPDLKIGACEEFILHYASSGMEDVIYDYEANELDRVSNSVTVYLTQPCANQ